MRRTNVLMALGGGALAALLAGTAAVAGTSGTAAPDPTSSVTCPAGCTGAGRAFGVDPDDDTGYGMGRGMGAHMGYRPGAGMMGRGYGSGAAGSLPAQGTLTAQQKTTLAAMAEEEKLAHDVYVALAASTGDARFTRIAASETQHLTAVRTLLQRYGVADPTVGKAAGQFTTPATQALYDKLVAQGKASLTAALGVGRTIETEDVADLTASLKGLDAPDVTRVYTMLLNGSRHHLAAFTR